MSARRITPSRILVSAPRWMTTSYWSAAKELPISSKRQTKLRLEEIFIHNLRWLSRVPRQNHAGCYQSGSVVNRGGEFQIILPSTFVPCMARSRHLPDLRAELACS